MLKCPHCGVELSEPLTFPATCPSCAQAIPEAPVDLGKVTVEDDPRPRGDRSGVCPRR